MNFGQINEMVIENQVNVENPVFADHQIGFENEIAREVARQHAQAVDFNEDMAIWRVACQSGINPF